MFGARDGVFYALRAADGGLAWKLPTGDRILQTASVSEDGRRVIFGSEDMRIYCLDVKDGALLWKSRKLSGLSLRDHFPLIVGGLAIVTTNPVKNFHAALGEHQNMLLKRTGFTGKDDRYIPGTAEDVRKEQDAILEYLKANPADQTFFALSLSDGLEPWVAPVLFTSGLHDPPSPPCHDPRTGEVFVLLRTAYGTWDGGGEVRPYTGVGRLDLKTGRVALVEHGHKCKEPGRPAGRKDMPWMTFNTIGDEMQTLSCAPEPQEYATRAISLGLTGYLPGGYTFVRPSGRRAIRQLNEKALLCMRPLMLVERWMALASSWSTTSGSVGRIMPRVTNGG